MKVLFAVKIGEPDYMEEVITENELQIEQAKKWAEENGYDRFRIANINMENPPDFTKALNPLSPEPPKLK